MMIALSVLALGASPAGAQEPHVADLRWLAGCWETQSEGVTIEEQWMEPRAGLLLGVGRTRRGESLLAYEFMRIYGRGDTLVFAAHPSGQEPAEFVALTPGEREVVFENPAHDFPQRVRYRATGTDSLVARIEGTRDGELQGIDFPYRRAVCPGSAPGPEAESP